MKSTDMTTDFDIQQSYLGRQQSPELENVMGRAIHDVLKDLLGEGYLYQNRSIDLAPLIAKADESTLQQPSRTSSHIGRGRLTARIADLQRLNEVLQILNQPMPLEPLLVKCILCSSYPRSRHGALSARTQNCMTLFLTSH